MKITRALIVIFLIFALINVADFKKSPRIKAKGFTKAKLIWEIIQVVVEVASMICDLKGNSDSFDKKGELNFTEAIKQQTEEIKQQYKEMTRKILEVSDKIDELSKTVSHGFDTLENIIEFKLLSRDLRNTLDTIDIQFGKSLEIRTYNNKTRIYKYMVEDFVSSVFTSANDVSLLLNRVHSLFATPLSPYISKSFIESFVEYVRVSFYIVNNIIFFVIT